MKQLVCLLKSFDRRRSWLFSYQGSKFSLSFVQLAHPLDLQEHSLNSKIASA